MRILIVAATSMEVAPAFAATRLRRDKPAGLHRLKSYRHGGHDVDLLVTGVGMVATAAWCSRALAQTPRYDLALNFGVCGSFDRALEPGAVVHVVSDRIAELGAEDDEAFLTIADLNLPVEPDLPVMSARLVNAAPPVNAALAGLPTVDGITVNTVHGNERSIAAVVKRFGPRVESMEGAAFMYACMIHEVTFAQVRAVSNLVEKRNRGAWKMAEAVRSLGTTSLAILETL
jgi:futalosine hydrolase